jgi:hypothetical protein
MISYFPKGYYDETWYSIICRYREHTLSTTHAACKDLFGISQIGLNRIIPEKLEYFLDRVGKYHSLTYASIIDNHTQIPIFSQVFSMDSIKRITDPWRVYGNQNVSEGRLIHPNYILKYCPICSENDFAIHREYYWHRAHNTPGIKICATHNCLLENWFCSAEEFDILNLIISADSVVNKIISKKNTNEPLYRFTKLVTSLLYGYVSNDMNAEAIRFRALKNQFLVVRKMKSSVDSGLFRKFIGYLSEVDKSLVKDEKNALRKVQVILLCKTPQVKHFLFQIALSEFISNIQSVPKTEYVLPFLFPCRNIFCEDHNRILPKRTTEYQNRSKCGSFGIVVKCDKCGMVYKFNKSSSRVFTIEYGEVFVKKVKELKSAGSSLIGISKKTGVHKHAIACLVNDLQIERKKDASTRIAIRTRYREILTGIILSTNFISIKASGLPGNIYKWMTKNDSEWYNELKAQVEKPRQKRRKHEVWEKIDDERMLVRIKEQKEDMLKKNVNRLICKSLLLTLVGLQKWHLKHLPKCQAFLETECENSFSMKKRRLRYHLLNQTASFLVPSRAVLIKKFKVYELNTKQKREADLIFEEFKV